MISSEVQRTLVKSPPELWAEISDPESLARHLGEFGEIRITRVEPEQRVEWQSGDTSGSVVIKPSGWGTKVMLTVTRKLAEQPAGASESQAVSQAEPASEIKPQAEAEAETELEAEPATEPPEPMTEEPAIGLERAAEVEQEFDEEFEQEHDEEFELEANEPEELLADDFSEMHPSLPQPRRGFFARLFGRRRRTLAPEPAALEVATDAEVDDADADADGSEEGSSAAAAEPYNALAVWASQIDSDADAVEEIDDEAHEYAAEAFTQPQPELADADTPDDEHAPADISAEIRAAEEVAAEEVTAVLTGVLDRLGAAHHRPFSRA